MRCAFCGGGDVWIKTCLARDGSRLRLCDPCYEALSQWFLVVSGDWVVAARCDHCWHYGNSRDFAKVQPGGRKDTYSGICAECVGEARR